MPCLFFFLILSSGNSSAHDEPNKPTEPIQPIHIKKPFISIEFDSLEGFTPVLFPKIPLHTEYSIVSKKEESYLRALSNSSASALVYTKEFNVYEHPQISWRWRVSNVYKKGHAGIKSGDDFPARVYVMFEFNPKEAQLAQRIIYSTLKAVYGSYPPHSTLNYIWASRAHEARYIKSPYSKRSRMVVLQTGPAENPLEWAHESVNVLQDYMEAFGGKNPPKVARIAVMVDSDNTKESATAHFDSITIGLAP